MAKLKYYLSATILTVFVTLLFSACDASSSQSTFTPPRDFSYDDYLGALENGYTGSFSDFFIQHNQIERIEIVDGNIYAYIRGDVVVNLGEANLNPPQGSISDTYYLHLSFDDTMNCLKNLTSSAPYESVFEEPFFAYLNDLHKNYGAKFSLYTYLDVLENVTDKYQKELGLASSWLKFGMHSTSHSERFNKATYEDGFNAWTKFAKNIFRITGTFRSIDRMPRLHYWEGTEAALQGMRDALCGPIGFLSSEHEWPSYYLTREQHMYAYNHDHIIDYKNGLTFVATDMRIDWFMKDYTSNNVYRKPIKSNIYDELEYRFSNVNYASTLSSYLVFGHEWMYYDGKKITEESKVWIEDICRFAYDQKIPFDYPQNKSFGPTPYDIHQ